MPLTKSGKKVLMSMQKQYGAKKGKSVFYASINKKKKGSKKWHRKSKSSKKKNSLDWHPAMRMQKALQGRK